MNNYRNILKYLIIVLIIIIPFYFLAKVYEGSYKGKIQRKPDKRPKISSYEKLDKASSERIRFVVMADSRGSDHGVNAKVITKIMGQIKRLNPQPEFALMPGDLVGGGTSYSSVKGQLEYFKKLVTKFYPERFFYPGIGNHEVNSGVNGEKALSEVFGKYKANFLKGYNRSVYYFDRGNTRFFMLNSDHPGSLGYINDEQLSWLVNNSKPNAKHNVYLFHQPAYPTGPHIKSSLDTHPFERDRFWQIIDQSNRPIVFCGHEHFYTRRHINSVFNETLRGISFRYTKSIYQVTVGSFGAPLYNDFIKTQNVDVPPILQYHFAVVDIEGNKLKTSVYNIEGKIIDSFEILSS